MVQWTQTHDRRQCQGFQHRWAGTAVCVGFNWLQECGWMIEYWTLEPKAAVDSADVERMNKDGGGWRIWFTRAIANRLVKQLDVVRVNVFKKDSIVLPTVIFHSSVMFNFKPRTRAITVTAVGLRRCCSLIGKDSDESGDYCRAGICEASVGGDALGA